MPRKTVPPAAWIFVTALAVRLVHVWQMRATPFFSVLLGDSRGYDEWARRIAAGEWIGRDVFYQAPLYPYMLAVVYALAGRHLLLVRVVQAAIGSASCVFLALAGERFVSRRAGIAAGLMLALYAPAIFFDGLIQKSVLDVFFLCIALYLIARIAVRPKPDITETQDADRGVRNPGGVRLQPHDRHPDRGVRDPGSVRLQPDRERVVWFTLGLAMGALALTRENALVFIVVIIAWALVFDRPFTLPHSASRGPQSALRIRRSALRRAAAFAAGVAVLLLPVAARNAYVGGGFYVTTSQAGPNFYIGNNANADGTYQSLRFGRGAPEYERQDATELAERGLGRALTPAEVSSYWIDKAMDFITSQPGAWLKLTARKAALLLNSTEVLDTESQETHAEYSWPLRVLGIVGHFGVLVPLVLLGVVFTWPLRRRLAIVSALTLAYAGSVVAFYVFARYRYPLVPMLMIFAGAGAVDARAWLTAHAGDRRSELALAAAVVATVALCNWPLLSSTMMRAVTETNLATALQTDGHIDEAVGHYRRAIALQPDYAPAYNNLGTALRAEGKPLEAVAEYQRALSVRAAYPEAHYNLANALTDAGRPKDAADHFRIALQALPGSADVHNNLGIALAEEGKRDDAIAEFRAAVAADPASAKSHRNLADALAGAGRTDEALIEFRRAAQLAPADGAMRYDLGSFLMELDRTEEAIVEFRAALKLTPRSVEAHNNLGIALATQGRMDDAITHWRAALAIDPDFADAKNNLQTALRARRND